MPPVRDDSGKAAPAHQAVTAVERRDYLLAAAAWQDDLLQSYRGHHLTIQGLLLASAAAVLSIQLAGTLQGFCTDRARIVGTHAAFNLLVALLFWVHSVTSREIRRVVWSRAQDVGFWHVRVIEAESALPPGERTFTEFKLFQRYSRKRMTWFANAARRKEYLSEAGLDARGARRLVRRGLPHTRRVLDRNLFRRVRTLWLWMLGVSLAVTAWSLFGPAAETAGAAQSADPAPSAPERRG